MSQCYCTHHNPPRPPEFCDICNPPKVIPCTNKYVIDTGAICIIAEAQSVRDCLEMLLVSSAYFKPSIFATYQPTISIEQRDLIVCNVGEQEVRIYPIPPTLTLNEQHYYLSAPFYTLPIGTKLSDIQKVPADERTDISQR
jgi:hypothetical protein